MTSISKQMVFVAKGIWAQLIRFERHVAQSILLRSTYRRPIRRLIVYIVPGSEWPTGRDTISGGLIAMLSQAEALEKMEQDTGYERVIFCTLTQEFPWVKSRWIQTPFRIFRLRQIFRYFQNLEKVVLHIPEYLVARSQADLDWISSHRDPGCEWRINILNQNIELMPTSQVVQSLKRYTPFVTQTTGFKRYTNAETQSRFGVPLHFIPGPARPSRFRRRSFSEKENLLLCSHDTHPMKDQIIRKLQRELPTLKIEVVQRMTYERYRILLERAKWILSFGEGFDAYFVEGALSGALPFAVYNDVFFPPILKSYEGVFSSFEEVERQLGEKIKHLDQQDRFVPLQEKAYLGSLTYESENVYTDALRDFYQGNYTFKG